MELRLTFVKTVLHFSPRGWLSLAAESFMLVVFPHLNSCLNGFGYARWDNTLLFSVTPFLFCYNFSNKILKLWSLSWFSLNTIAVVSKWKGSDLQWSPSFGLHVRSPCRGWGYMRAMEHSWKDWHVKCLLSLAFSHQLVLSSADAL